MSTLAQSSGTIYLPMLVVCPYASGSGWKGMSGDGEDVDFIANLITSLSTSQGVPPGRVLITGFSAGGSMAYRVYCERADVIGGIVPWGQTFFEPTGGHVQKGSEIAGMTSTQQALQIQNTARQGAGRCTPQPTRPHYALVGTADGFYGEAGGVYSGKILWEFFSTNVLGCTGSSSAALTGQAAQTITGKSGSTCYEYPSCPGLASASLNRYCTTTGFGHDTAGWEGFVAAAFGHFFGGPAFQPPAFQTPAFQPPAPLPRARLCCRSCVFAHSSCGFPCT